MIHETLGAIQEFNNYFFQSIHKHRIDPSNFNLDDKIDSTT